MSEKNPSNKGQIDQQKCTVKWEQKKNNRDEPLKSVEFFSMF